MALGAPVLPLNHVVFTVQAEIRPAMRLFTERVDTPRGPNGWEHVSALASSRRTQRPPRTWCPKGRPAPEPAARFLCRAERDDSYLTRRFVAVFLVGPSLKVLGGLGTRAGLTQV